MNNNFKMTAYAFLVFIAMPFNAVAVHEHDNPKIFFESFGPSFKNPTSMKWLSQNSYLIAEKRGRLYYVTPKGKKLIANLEVNDYSELGLLDVEIDPRFSKNRMIYIHYNPKGAQLLTKVSLFYWPVGKNVSFVKEILSVNQPYSNHNGGAIVFDKKNRLYIGLGDGGAGGDPLGHGQNIKSKLGSIQVVDFNPKDRKKFTVSTYATGVRNPWRMSFDKQNRLVVADVGQNKFEELSFAEKGDNLGWNIKEGYSCFKSNKCKVENERKPFFTYNHKLGASITGGHEIGNQSYKSLIGHYIFADFASGRFFALKLPESSNLSTSKYIDLGVHNISVSSFSKATDGSLYALGYKKGKIFKVRVK